MLEPVSLSQIELGTGPGGDQLLRISVGGAVTLMEWDGKEEEAEAIIRGVAANDADRASLTAGSSKGGERARRRPARKAMSKCRSRTNHVAAAAYAELERYRQRATFLTAHR